MYGEQFNFPCLVFAVHGIGYKSSDGFTHLCDIDGESATVCAYSFDHPSLLFLPIRIDRCIDVGAEHLLK